MWQQFVDGLAATGILAVDPTTFKAASGLAIADWEVINFTGLGPVSGNGTPIASHVFNWADPMPDETVSLYQPGPSFSDAYAMFLGSLLVASVDSATIAMARARLSQYQMTDGIGHKWPSYGITPGLNNFLLACLQSVSKGMPNQIDFSLPAQAASGGPVEHAVFRSALTAPVSIELPFFGIDQAPMNFAQLTAARLPAISLVPNVSPPVTDAGTPVTTIRFQAQAAQMFSMQPGQWFSSNVLSMFYNRIDPTSVLANKAIFGHGGWLNGRVSQVLVAFRRVVTISGPQAVVAGMQLAVKHAVHTFNVGSFHFAADSAQTGVTLSNPGAIVFQDNTNAPYVVGVGVELFHATS